MTNEKGKGLEVYRKLLYFYENKKKIHFKDLDKIFYNGTIIDLNGEKLCMVLDERVRGIIPVLLECIEPNSIQEFKDRGKNDSY